MKSGFTLIELSIVLVIIGLIIGGILVGQDLIKSAANRAQISQIEHYYTAVHTFQNKYGGLPGDLKVSLANQFGFSVGPNCTGQVGGRDGNGMIVAYPAEPYWAGGGEGIFFWQDLSAAGLIDGTYPNMGIAVGTCNGVGVLLTTAELGAYFPSGKIGSTYLYVYNLNGANWYAVSALTSTNALFNGNPGIPVIQAYNIDTKIDDGIPISGNVQAVYLHSTTTATNTAPNAATDGATTCYNTTNNVYSIGYSGGTAENCAMSFIFQ